MVYFLVAFLKNAFQLAWRVAIWPLLLFWRRKPLILKIDLPSVPARRPAGRLARWLGREEIDLETLLGMLEVVRRDRAFGGVLVSVPALGMGRAVAAEIRAALHSLVEGGRSVTLVLREGGGMRELRLAPPGSRVVLHPSAVIRLEGLAVMPVSAGELFERVGVRADLEAIGEYKTAPEMFTRTELSERNREQITALLEDLDAALVDDIAAGRGVDRGVVRGWMARQVFTPPEAVEAGVVDASAFHDEVEAEPGGGALVVGPGDAAARARLRWRFVPLRRPHVVAVISIRGQILMRGAGMQHARAALASRIVPLIERAGRNPAVRAIVLDIDSRGGSVVASDAIYRQARSSAGLKPVVAVIGDVAASGGYYIASAAHEIVASPDAITGSIGVFGGKVASDGVMERLGIKLERVTLGDPAAGLMLPDRPFTDEERRIVRKEMEAIYETFLDVVASRKGRSREDVEPIAGGRVFSARRALGVDLVDAIGTRRELVTALARRLGCPPGRVVLRPFGRERLFEELAMAPSMHSALVRAAATIRLVASERIAAEMPFDLIMGSP